MVAMMMMKKMMMMTRPMMNVLMLIMMAKILDLRLVYLFERILLAILRILMMFGMTSRLHCEM